MTNRSEFNAKFIEEFQRHGGKLASRPGQQLVLLHTVGAKTGLHRPNLVSYLQGEDCIYVFATNGGSPAHPRLVRQLGRQPSIQYRSHFRDVRSHGLHSHRA